MSNRRVTLKDVSLETGASLSTVHRALYNKAGVSDELRDAIIEKANQMGYKANYVASSLKRKPVKLAVLLPAPSRTNKYFYMDMWKGLRDFMAEVREFNVEFLEYTFSGTDASQARELEAIYKSHGDDLAGMITISLNDTAISYFIDQFAAKNIPVVFISSDMRQSKRLCCVRAHDQIAGSLAAEWIDNVVQGPGRVLVAAGDIVTSSHYRNVEGFEDYLAERHSRLEAVKIYDKEGPESVYEAVLAELKKGEDIRALYSCTARDTVAIAKAVAAANLPQKPCVVGSDVFEESTQLLKSRAIQAIIYKNPYRQAYLGIKTLFNHVIKGEYPASDTLFVVPTIIMSSNLALYNQNEAY